MLPEELEGYFLSIGEPKFRAKQVFARLHKGERIGEITNLSKALRQRLVEETLDALPEVPFEGYVSSIGLFCHPKDPNNPRHKVFDVEVRLLVSDERLKPGMTVSCEYLPD